MPFFEGQARPRQNYTKPLYSDANSEVDMSCNAAGHVNDLRLGMAEHDNRVG